MSPIVPAVLNRHERLTRDVKQLQSNIWYVSGVVSKEGTVTLNNERRKRAIEHINSVLYTLALGSSMNPAKVSGVIDTDRVGGQRLSRS